LNSVSPPFRIKVCGITGEDAARAALVAGADHLGLVFCPSPRRVTFERAKALMAEIPASWVGVFAGSTPSDVARAARSLGLAAVQLHGSETPDECRAVRERAAIPVWKSVDPGIPAAEEGYLGTVDALLLDSGRGGSGRPLDWTVVAARFPRARRSVPVILAGGLDPDNVARAIREARPDGVDASSRLESAPGVKDPELVRRFVSRARAEAGSAGDLAGAAR
jgi:phosphoribosylanthranilate isomerase